MAPPLYTVWQYFIVWMETRGGILTKGFTFKTVEGLEFSVERGTKVVVREGMIYFLVNPELPLERQPVRAWRDGCAFYVLWHGKLHLLEPFFEQVPYPFTMITPSDVAESVARGTHLEEVATKAHKHFKSACKSLRARYKATPDESRRRELREELVELARKAAEFFKSYEVDWGHHYWMGEFYMRSAMLKKIAGDYEGALEDLKGAMTNIKGTRSTPRPEDLDLEKELENQEAYCSALRYELEAQAALFSYKFAEAVENYERAARYYAKTRDRTSASWCRALYNVLRALKLIFEGEPSGAYECLREVYTRMPRELKREVESWKERLREGEVPTPDRVLIAVIIALASMYEERNQRLISHYKSIIGKTLEAYVTVILLNEGYEVWLEKRKISEPLNDKERELIDKYGVLEIDIIGMNRFKGELILGECKAKGKKTPKSEVEKFLEKAEVFAEREVCGRRGIKVRKIFVSLSGFTDKCYQVKGVELIDGEELREWARRLHMPPLSLNVAESTSG